MSNHQQQFSSTLWQKRNTFANEIRRVQRGNIIGEKRKVLYQEHLKLLAEQKGTAIENIPYSQLLKKLEPGIGEEKVLHQLLLRLQSVNQNPKMIVEKIFQTGKYCYLIENLNSGRFLNQTLSVFSVILARPDFEKTQFLVNKGFLQILLELFPQHLELSGRISNIIGNICIDSDDYCDWILQNYKHALIFDVFKRLYDLFLQNQISFNPENDLKMILWMMAIIVGTRDSTLDFTTQFDEVLNFSIKLMEERIMIPSALNIVFQLAIKNPQRVEQVVHPVLNALLREETGNSEHFEDLLILINRMSPGNFDYHIIFDKTLLSNYQKIKKTLEIIQKIVDTPSLYNLLANEAWWDRTLTKLEGNTSESKMAITLIRKLKITFNCVWRYVSEHLDDTYSKDVICEILMLLRNALIDAHQAKDRGQLMIEELKRHKIEKKLEVLIDKSSKQLVDRIEEVLFLIRDTANQLKDKYQLDVQI